MRSKQTDFSFFGRKTGIKWVYKTAWQNKRYRLYFNHRKI